MVALRKTSQRTATNFVEPQPYQFTFEEYQRLGDIGIAQGKRVELIGGMIFEMSPQHEHHVVTIEKIRRQLDQILSSEFWIRIQSPLGLVDGSAPEPDIAVIRGNPDHFDHHPTTASLVIEVSISSLYYDLTKKASLYAASGVTDYWVVDVEARRIEVFRSPEADPAADFDSSYRSHTVHLPGDILEALIAPGVNIDPICILPKLS